MSTHRESGDLSRGNKRLKNGGAHDDGAADRLSSLPDPVLCHILSLLPTTKEAVQTSVLSKSWRFLWNSVSTLVFSSSSSLKLDFGLNKFAQSVQKTLTHHSAPQITKFLISCRFHNSLDSRIDNWVRYALHHHVQHLTLDFANHAATRYLLPGFLYTDGQHLSKLTISGCIIRTPAIFHLPSLTDLSLGSGNASNAALATLLSGCPLLESLELFHCAGSGFPKICSARLKRLTAVRQTGHSRLCSKGCKLHVSAPKLKSLRLLGGWVFEDVQIDASSSVQDFELHLDLSESHHHRTGFKRLLEAFPQLEYLSLRPAASPKGVFMKGDIVDGERGYWRLQGKQLSSSVSCLKNHLKKVKIVKFGPNKEGWEFIDPFVEFVLENACVLEKLTIRVQNACKASTTLKLNEALVFIKGAQQLLSYHRASPSAAVYFIRY